MRLPRGIEGSAPGWVQALAVYGASRLLTFVLVAWLSRFQGSTSWGSPAFPGYGGVLANWDGIWYRMIAEEGYPAEIPRHPRGGIGLNPWAFYPVFPMTARAVMATTGLSFPVAGSLVALVCGAGAAVVLRSLVERAAGPSTAIWTVVLFCTFPAAPVLQMTYTESTAALFLFGVFWCLQRQRYLLAAPLVLLAGMSRSIGIPLALVVGVHTLRRVHRRLRHREPLPVTQLLALGLLCGDAAAGAVAWFLIVEAVTGEPYAVAQAPWRGGHTQFWWTWSIRGEFLFGAAWVPVVVAASAGYAWWVTRGASRRVLGADMLTWALGYVAYLVAAVDLWSSLFRYLLLLFPAFVLLAAASPSRAYRWSVTVAFVVGQVLWIALLWLHRESVAVPP